MNVGVGGGFWLDICPGEESGLRESGRRYRSFCAAPCGGLMEFGVWFHGLTPVAWGVSPPGGLRRGPGLMGAAISSGFLVLSRIPEFLSTRRRDLSCPSAVLSPRLSPFQPRLGGAADSVATGVSPWTQKGQRETPSPRRGRHSLSAFPGTPARHGIAATPRPFACLDAGTIFCY